MEDHPHPRLRHFVMNSELGSRRDAPGSTLPGDRVPEVAPATAERWKDLERLFGDRGACGGCWCMHWRLPAAEYEAAKGEENRRSLKARVRSDRPPPGVIAYLDEEPVGWCAVAPRKEFPRFERSRILAPVDDEPVWSIVCFFVSPSYRRKGVTRHLIRGAVQLAKACGASVVEAYPSDPGETPMVPVFAFTGLASAFFEEGFEEVARRSPKRPILRLRSGSDVLPARGGRD